MAVAFKKTHRDLFIQQLLHHHHQIVLVPSVQSLSPPGTSGQRETTVVPEGGVCWLLKLQVFVNVLSRMIFPPLRTNIPPSPRGWGAGWLVSRARVFRPLKTHTGRKYIPNQAENTAGPSSTIFFFLGFPLYMFPFTCALLLFIITTQGPAAAAGPSSSCLGGCCPRAVLNIIIFHIMLFQTFEGIRIGATISARQQRKSFFSFSF